MLNKSLKKMFYSKLFENIRLEYYKEAYDQGKLDKEIEKNVQDAFKKIVNEDDYLKHIFGTKEFEEIEIQRTGK